ncbi:heterodisulfide reductase-related iron-sulfur binding cluster [Deinococcus wulumuqiensis]|uniref:Iron-sulfur-binding protein n=1 Tax=Deinococcus wulumuqiensis TaxID=980427 RepID=A0AAV4K877_9DEIO|nr:4Fe-4S dicluster domain-containing protein [Deinococcus wulumuqiensis]QII21376.1 4Fe-4S dicluster domain-containing protein [Deinococcus wulumuqiensis R12]GGI83000.1 iron-sulfur-binding protein [Deinococcus wulumuqiensis]GGP29527.1 iron-sulfur-binding protein [Deinococcus wulumuqiensis]
MLPLEHQIAFFVFALVAGGLGAFGFYRLFLRVKRGAPASEWRWNDAPQRIGYALWTSLTQERTFRKRPWISVLHSFIFYGFVYYLLVNVVDGLEGYFHFSVPSSHPLGAAYNFLADLLSFGVLIGVLGLLYRRLWGKSRRDFRFTEKTLLHPLVKENYIKRDSLIVSSFILFHVGSRILGNMAKMVEEARLHGGQYDAFQPFSSALGSALFGGLSDSALHGWRIFGFWGALGSILLFLSYFPFSKHIHIFMAPLNYALKRPVNSGTLPPMKGLEEAMESEDPKLGVEKLEDLEWPRLLDAYACIQCNRCQDVCPANATGKALSPAALEINKRMELNVIAAQHNPFVLRPVPFEAGDSTARPLLEYAINEESVWACTTCGACMQVCPVQDEQMLDIVDIRRNLVMVQGEFPPQLQTAFRGMERASNPWGISRDKRMEWAEGLKVPTIDENPEPDVIYWVGCAASYDPGAQKVARSFVQLLDKAGVNYAVLGKKEACTGDSARRAGNEFLYQQLAQENVETLNQVAPKLIVATCPHCMNAIGNEYRQIGGDYRTIHHTEYLEQLVAAGKLPTAQLSDNIVFHDPCYLGRHNGVYDAPRQLITQMAGQILDIERQRENSFCCGAGGAQFWKEEEEGRERVSDNRFRELQARLDSAAEASAEFERSGKVLAVGCPFCKSMMNSTPEKQKRDDIVVKDVAELMLESVQRASGEWVQPEAAPSPEVEVPNAALPMERTGDAPAADAPRDDVVGTTSADVENAQPGSPVANAGTQPEPQAAAPSPAPSGEGTPVPAARKSWTPKGGDDVSAAAVPAPAPTPDADGAAPARKSWKPKASSDDVAPAAEAVPVPAPAAAETGTRKAWKPKAKAEDVSAETVAETVAQEPAPAPAPAAPASADGAAPARKAWNPKAKAEAPAPAPVRDDVNPAPVAQAAAPAAPAESGSTGRKAWNPRAKAPAASEVPAPVQEAAPQPAPVAPVAAPAPVQDDIQDPLPQPPVQQTQVQTSAPATSAPAQSGERKKWNPKAKAEASSSTVSPQPSAPAPITEHVVLDEVGVNGLEEGHAATSAPDAAQGEVPVTTQPAVPQPAAVQTGEVNAETGRKKWQPRNKG